jgi:hypothetical protein
VFQELQAIWSMMNPPDEVRVSEAFMLHQSLAGYYYLRRKFAIAAKNCKAADLKEWLEEGQEAVEHRIQTYRERLTALGIPAPPPSRAC